MHVGLDLGTRRIAAACPEVGFVFSTGKWGDTAQAKRDWPAESDVGFALGRQLHTALVNCPAFMERWGVEGASFTYERPMAVMNIKTAIGQAFSAGALLTQIRAFGAGTECSNSQWKKELIGHGRADKVECRAWLEAHHPSLAALCGQDQDLIDASCIALWAAVAP